MTFTAHRILRATELNALEARLATLEAGGGEAAATSQVLNALYSPRDYGAIADDAWHTVSEVLGITTLVALVDYVHPILGGTPYAWLNSGVWVSDYLNLDISAPMSIGDTTLTFASTAGVAIGMQVRGIGIQAGTTVTNFTSTVVTLSAATTVAKAIGMTFSFVTLLSDADIPGLMMDSLGAQSAIQAAAAGGGGTVVLGAGTYILDKPLVIPESGEFGGTQVNLTGAGIFLTTLRAKEDFGTGRFLLCCGDPVSHKNLLTGRYAFAYYEGECRDFTVQAPLRRTPQVTPTGNDIAFGAVPHNMSGIGHGARRTWQRVWSLYFRHCWSIVGDHSLFTQCVGQYGYYDWYWADANPTLYGDLRFEYCFFTGATFAGIGVSKNAVLNGEFVKPYFGGEPYHIAGEAGTSDDYGQPFAGSTETPLIQGSLFDLGQWEWAGNGSIVDLNGGADGSGTRTRPIAVVAFDGGNWSWDTGKQISGRGQRYYIDVGAMEGVEFRTVGNGSFDVTAGQLACLRMNSIGYYGGGVHMAGAMDTVLDKYNGIIPFVAEGFGRFSEGHWRKMRMTCQDWTGWLGMVNTTAAVLKGTAIEASSDFGGVRPATGTTAFPMLGVCVQGVAADASGTDRFLVYAKGEHLKARYGSGNVPASVWVKSTASGTLQPATGPTDGQVIGWVWNDNGQGNTGPGDRTIRTTIA